MPNSASFLASYQPPRNTILASKPSLLPGYTLYSKNYVDRKVAEALSDANSSAQAVLTTEKRVRGFKAMSKVENL